MNDKNKAQLAKLTGEPVERDQKNFKTISSVEVAEMLGKDHYELLKDIEGRKDGKNVGIIPVLEKGNFHVSDYFIPSTYQAGNREYKCYEVTKMGCELLGNKQQGEKGILFTAKYVKRFNDMEQELQDSYLIADPIERAKRWIEEQEEKKQLALEVKVQEQQIKELQPKATYYDLVLQSTNAIPISVIAKDYGMGAPTLNNKLHELGVQYKQGNIWLLYTKYQDKGYTQTKTHTVQKHDGTPDAKPHTYWTQKGRLFIYDLLKQNGILPMIEREVA